MNLELAVISVVVVFLSVSITITVLFKFFLEDLLVSKMFPMQHQFDYKFAVGDKVRLLNDPTSLGVVDQIQSGYSITVRVKFFSNHPAGYYRVQSLIKYIP